MVVARRKIRQARITHISLCRRAVNQMPVLMKSSGALRLEMLTKATKEGIVYALVYVPDRVDSQGDVADRQVIKSIAHDYLSNAAAEGGGIDIEHNLLTLDSDKVRLAETFIVQKGDPRFEGWKDTSGAPVDPEGSWGIALKVLDPTLRAAFESGELNGVSMYGLADLEIVGKAEDLQTNPPQEDKMTPQEMKDLAIEIAKALKPEQQTVVQKSAEPVEFEGDMFNPEDVARHAEKLLFKSLDLTKPSDLSKWQAHLAKKSAKVETPADGASSATAEIARLEGEIERLRKSSSAPITAEKKTETQVGNLKKAEADAFANGRAAMRKFQGLPAK